MVHSIDRDHPGLALNSSAVTRRPEPLMPTTCPAVTPTSSRRSLLPSCGSARCAEAPRRCEFHATRRDASVRRRRRTRAGSALRVMVPLVLRRVDPAHARGRRLVHQDPFDTLNELSTPPAADHGDRLSGDQAITIDHGPRRTPCARRGAPRGCRNNPRRRPPRHQAASDGRPARGGAGHRRHRGQRRGQPVVVATIGTPALANAPSGTEDSYAFLMMGVDARPGERSMSVCGESRSWPTSMARRLVPVCRSRAIPHDASRLLPSRSPRAPRCGFPDSSLLLRNARHPDRHYADRLRRRRDARRLVGGVTVEP